MSAGTVSSEERAGGGEEEGGRGALIRFGGRRERAGLALRFYP